MLCQDGAREGAFRLNLRSQGLRKGAFIKDEKPAFCLNKGAEWVAGHTPNSNNRERREQRESRRQHEGVSEPQRRQLETEQAQSRIRAVAPPRPLGDGTLATLTAGPPCCPTCRS